jgi:type II secretory pathway component PulJ
VVLAVSIAIGLLLVMLHFYRQAADLRTQLLLEAERVSSIRLVMDRITEDLRSARNDNSAGYRMEGGATSIRFVRGAAPSLVNWRGGQLGRAAFPETDLRRVAYRMGAATLGTNWVATGLIRTDEPAVELRRSRAEPAMDEPATAPAPDSRAPAEEPLSETIRYLRFRYWDGAGWKESWSGTDLPLGLEVTLASEPPSEASEPEEETTEIFRRVIFLSAGVWASRAGNAVNSLEAASMEGEVAP